VQKAKEGLGPALNDVVRARKAVGSRLFWKMSTEVCVMVMEMLPKLEEQLFNVGRN